MSQLSLDDAENWLPVIGYEGLYEVSDCGRIRSLPRATTRGGIMKLISDGRGYLAVTLTRQGKQRRYSVHCLVAGAFRGSRPEGQEIRHLDGNPSNNWAYNLAYGTHSENIQDSVRHGTNRNAAKTHCPKKHEYTPDNTLILPGGSRVCRTCLRARTLEQYHDRRARGLPWRPAPATEEEAAKRRALSAARQREYQKRKRRG